MSFPFTRQPDWTTTAATMRRRSIRLSKSSVIQTLRAEQKKARAEGRLVGIGVSTYVEICALGPSQAMPAGGWESATVRIEPTGKVTVMTGASPHGQGQETSFAQIAADELGVDLNDVTVDSWRHCDCAIRHRNIRQPRNSGWRHGGLDRDPETERESEQDCRAHVADGRSLGWRFSQGGQAAAIRRSSEPAP